MNDVFVVDIIGEVVNATKAAVLATIQANETTAIGLPTGIATINYQYGHYNELMETLFQYDQSPDDRVKKYPLVWLRTDFRERRGQQGGIYAEVFLNLCIMHHTTQTYKSTERKAKVFEPVLYPIYYELLNQLYKHHLVFVQSDEMISHDKYDRYYWGNTKQGKTNDFVDAIELDNLQLKISYINCP